MNPTTQLVEAIHERLHVILMERRLRQLCNSFPQISGVPNGNKASLDEVLAGYAKLRAQVNTGPMVIEAEYIIRKEQSDRVAAILRAIADAVDTQIGEDEVYKKLEHCQHCGQRSYNYSCVERVNAERTRMRTFTAALREAAK